MSIRLPFSLRVIQLMTNFPWKEADEDAELCPPRPPGAPTNASNQHLKRFLQIWAPGSEAEEMLKQHDSWECFFVTGWWKEPPQRKDYKSVVMSC